MMIVTGVCRRTDSVDQRHYVRAELFNATLTSSVGLKPFRSLSPVNLHIGSRLRVLACAIRKNVLESPAWSFHSIFFRTIQLIFRSLFFSPIFFSSSFFIVWSQKTKEIVFRLTVKSRRICQGIYQLRAHEGLFLILNKFRIGELHGKMQIGRLSEPIIRFPIRRLTRRVREIPTRPNEREDAIHFRGSLCMSNIGSFHPFCSRFSDAEARRSQ